MVLRKLHGFELGKMSFFVSWAEHSEWNIGLWQYWNKKQQGRENISSNYWEWT